MGCCCSSVEQVSWKKGGQGMRDEVADGWKISQVEVLVGLPRRDIQRACYEGAGGLGIVKPRNTTWGWRVYEVPDVAKLFLLAQGRRQGKTLDEVRDELASCEGSARRVAQACAMRAGRPRGLRCPCRCKHVGSRVAMCNRAGGRNGICGAYRRVVRGRRACILRCACGAWACCRGAPVEAFRGSRPRSRVRSSSGFE